MTTLKHFVDTLVFNCKLANVNVRCFWDSPENPSPCRVCEIDDENQKHYLTTKFNPNFIDYNEIYYSVYFAVDDSRIGFTAVQAYLDKNKNVIAADILQCQPSLIATMQMLKMFNGIPYKQLGRSNEENGWIVYY